LAQSQGQVHDDVAAVVLGDRWRWRWRLHWGRSVADRRAKLPRARRSSSFVRLLSNMALSLSLSLSSS
jgi:hypothetical protein